MVIVHKVLDPTTEHRVWAYTASSVTAPMDLFLYCPALGTDVFYFEDRSYGTLLVHYFQVKFQLFFAMPHCSILFILSEQHSLSWRNSIVVCPDGHGEGSRVSLEHLQSTMLWKGFCNTHLHFQHTLSKCHYCEFIVLAILGFPDF